MIDIVIIGAGASGLAIAHKLAFSKKSVLMASEKTLKNYSYHYNHSSYKDEISGFKGYGGNLNIWGNVCRPLDVDDFFEGNKYYPSKKSFIEASILLNCSYGLKYWFSENRSHNLFYDSVESILNKHNLRQNTYTMNVPPLPFDDKLVRKIYKKTAFDNFNQQKKAILDNFMIKTITENKDKTYSVTGVCQKTKINKVLHTKFIVLAAGTVKNFEILSRSLINNKLVEKNHILSKLGKNISDHIHGNIGSLIFKDKIKTPGKKISKSMRLRCSFSPSSKSIKGRHGVYLLPAFGELRSDSNEELKKILISLKKNKLYIFKLIKEFIKDPKAFIEIFYYVFLEKRELKKFYIWGVFEQLSSKHTLEYDKKNDCTIVNWSISDQDYYEIQNVMKYSAKIFKGITKTSNIFSKNILSQSLVPAQHLVGSLMQGDDKQSVVDKKYKLIGYENIYCADASILPAKGFANITLTVVANSLQLGESLK
ncbi:MAG: GMC family oxidoreductase N-terminal domain-containing protein [Methylophilaceae bacterium]